MITVMKVTEFNASRKPDKNGYRYTFETYRGFDRLTGWVASYKNCHFWARTKKEAYRKCAESIKIP